MAGMDKVVAVGMLAVGLAAGSGIAWVARGATDSKEKQKLKDEIEASNRDVESLLATFALESARMQRIIADISIRNPSTSEEMTVLLKGHGLNSTQTEAIILARFGKDQKREAK